MRWSTEVERARWWVDRLSTREVGVDDLRHIVPGGFEAVCRIFHPIESRVGNERSTWTAMAEANGRIPHPEMQLHAVSTPVGTTPVHRINEGPRVDWGDLPRDEVGVLAAELERRTATPDACWFGVWEGYCGLGEPLARCRFGSRRRSSRWKRRKHSESLVRAWVRSEGLVPKRVDGEMPPSRQYFMLEGSVAEIDQVTALIGRRSPNLWWPDDEAWFVITEIDFAWTYVAGSRPMVDALLACPGLEAFEADYSHATRVDGDRLNG